jgi:hypothetical protein
MMVANRCQGQAVRRGAPVQAQLVLPSAIAVSNTENAASGEVAERRAFDDRTPDHVRPTTKKTPAEAETG